MTDHEARLLAYLRRRKGERWISDAAKAVGLSPVEATRAVRPLVAAGLVRRVNVGLYRAVPEKEPKERTP